MKPRGYNSEFNNHHNNDVGYLHLDGPQKSTGKKVFKWEFHAHGSHETIPVDVSLVMHKGGALEFLARCSKPKSTWRHSDVAILAKMVETDLLLNAGMLSGIEWEDWFEVIVSGDNSDFDDSNYSALGANLKIQVNKLKRGVIDGKVKTISSYGNVVDFPKPWRVGVNKLDISSWDSIGERDENRAYIKATPGNRAALDDILNRMALLRDKLTDFLAHEQIEESMKIVHTLLPLIAQKDG